MPPDPKNLAGMLREWLGDERLNWSGTPGELASALKVSVAELLSFIETNAASLERLGIQATVKASKSGMRQVTLSRSDQPRIAASPTSATLEIPKPARIESAAPAQPRESASAVVIDSQGTAMVMPPPSATPSLMPAPAARTAPITAPATPAATASSMVTLAPRANAAPVPEFGRVAGQGDPESARRTRLFAGAAAAALLSIVALVWIFAGSSGPQSAVQSQDGAVQQGDVAEHYPSLVASAKAGDTSAQYTLGMKYLRGDGGDVNRTAAVEWLQKAARGGHSSAQYELGNAYAAGKGVRADQRTAYAWLAIAEANGEARAEDSLRQVASGMSRADLGEARFKVGDMYARGTGVRRDTVAAYSWYSLAEKAGNDNAKKTTAGMASRMSAEDVAAGRSRAADWLQGHGGGK